MKYLTFISAVLSLLVVYTFLEIFFGSCAPNAHAEIRAEWHHIYGTEDMGSVNVLETDGHRLYAEGNTGVYFSLDDGYTWRYAELAHGLEQFYIIAIGIGQNAVYAGTHNHGVYRSDSRGVT